MSLDARNLNEAVRYWQRLMDLRAFRRLVKAGDKIDIECRYSCFTVTLSMGSTREALLAALDAEERMLRHTLEMFDVALPADLLPGGEG